MSITELCIIYPPLSVHEFPHLALPLLKGFLNDKGIEDVAIRDFNVDIMCSIIKKGFDKVEKYFAARGLKLDLSEAEKNYELARSILSDEHERTKDEWAFKILNTYTKIAGSGISDYCFSPGSFNEIKRRYDLDDINGSNLIIKYIREEVLPDLLNHPAKVIGISIPFASQIYYALLIGREIKRRSPQTKVVFGGAQISLFWKIIISYKPFRDSYDALIYGNGEMALFKYVLHQRGDCTLNEIPNLIYFDAQSNEAIVNPQAEAYDVKLLPLPDFTGLPLQKYVYPKIPYSLSRGCYWSRCAFCSYRNSEGYTSRDVDQIINDIVVMKNKYGRRFFHFIDDAIHPELIKNVAENIVQRNIKIKYESYLRLDRRFTQDLCMLLAQSGMRSVLFGLESGNKRVLKLMNKGIDLDEVVKVISNMKNAGIKSVLSCLIGFPTETREEAWDSINFLVKHKDMYEQAFIVHYGLISDMCDYTDRYGITSVNLDNPVRYDDTGFLALGYDYKTERGMETPEALSVIKEAREAIGIQLFEDCFFS